MMKEEIDSRSSLPEQGVAALAGKPPTDSPPTESPPTESPPTESPPTESPPTESPPTESPPTGSPATVGRPRSGGTAAASDQPVAAQQASGWRSPWLIVVLVALGLAAWQWYETRQKLADTQQELARRLADSDSSGQELRALSKGAQEQVAGVLDRLAALEGKIGESQSQRATLAQLFQDLARNRDEWALAEVEQSVTLAAQQLQLAGNVQAAVLALQTADARLAASSRPQFISLRKVLSSDLDRLRALPQIDIAAMSLRLESVIKAIDTIPLAVDARPRPSGDSAPDAADGALVESPTSPATAWPPVISAEFWQRLLSAEPWQQLGREVWGEVKSLIRIQRFDREEPALLAPGQAFFLRENLKLRLLNARLALLAHDQWTFRNELKHTQDWIGRYFDASDAALLTAQANLEQLLATEIDIELPTLNESLSAVKTFKLGQERPQ